MSSKFSYNIGEKMLCYHGPLIYEAKCLKKSTVNGELRYFIHYAGWNKNWDEWVTEVRMLKYNIPNINKKVELDLLHAANMEKNKKKKGKKLQAKKKTDEPGPSKKQVQKAKEKPKKRQAKKKTPEPVRSKRQASKRQASKQQASKQQASKRQASKRQASKRKENNSAGAGSSHAPKLQPKATAPAPSTDQPKEKDALLNTPSEPPLWIPVNNSEYEIKIPGVLMSWLYDDWYVITRLHKLIDLPANITITQILRNYIIWKKNEHIYTESDLARIVKEINKYFDVMLGCRLLYKIERPQYAEILEDYPGKPMSQIYGAIHLLRLIVKTREILPIAGLSHTRANATALHMQYIVDYVMANRVTLYNLQEYVTTTREYQRRLQ